MKTCRQCGYLFEPPPNAQHWSLCYACTMAPEAAMEADRRRKFMLLALRRREGAPRGRVRRRARGES